MALSNKTTYIFVNTFPVPTTNVSYVLISHVRDTVIQYFCLSTNSHRVNAPFNKVDFTWSILFKASYVQQSRSGVAPCKGAFNVDQRAATIRPCAGELANRHEREF